jgi:N-acylneuraminate cytidylyltransferase
MSCVAIITARGGSKRIPGKNIKSFHGRPIIAYSIEAAIASKIFDEVMVSTDDDQIAEAAKSFGAIVPFKRTAKTSDDHSTTAEVLTEVILEYKQRKKNFEFACCIYPTAPFVTSEKLANAFEKLKTSGADCVLPVTKFSFPIWRSFKMNDDKVHYNWPEFALKRSQDLPPSYHDCGQFYFFNTERFLQTNQLVTDNTIGFEVPESEVQDIDNEEDWKIAEIKYDMLLKKNKQ